MAEKPIFVAHKSPEEIAEYLRDQRLFGARNFPHFEDAAQRIENYGEINQRHSPENREALVFMLSMVAQVTASGLLEQMYKEPKMMANGTSRQGVGADIWLEYWTTPGVTQISMIERLSQLINPTSALLSASEDKQRQGINSYLHQANILLYHNAHLPQNYFDMLARATKAKAAEAKMKKG